MKPRVRVKVCGVTCVEDAAAAVEAGADAVGLNFYPDSPRYVTPERARELAASLPPFIEAVGVFVRHSLEQARAFLEPIGRVRTVQVHGGDAEVIGAYPWRYVPAFALRDEG